MLVLGTYFLGSSDALLSGFEPDFLCLWLLEFRSAVSASLFLFGVVLLLAVEEDDGVDAGVVVGLGLGAPVLSNVFVSFVARVLLAGPGLFLDLFNPDGPAILLASSHGCSKSSP